MKAYIDSPFLDVLVDLLLNIVCNLLSFLEEVLKNELSTSVFKDRIGNLCDCCTEILNSVVCKPRVNNSIIHCCINVDRNVILSNDVLG